MQKLYVFGHVNPDTDSICAAITLANLKRKEGYNAEERTLGNINKETKYVLDYFSVNEPKYLNDTKLRIKDIDYRHGYFINQNDSVEDTYNYMLSRNTTGVPIVDDNKKFINIITSKDILNKSLGLIETTLYTSYENILKTLKGEKVVKVDDEIKGVVSAAAFAHETFASQKELTNEDILIVGDRHYIIDLAIKSKVKLIIIVGGNLPKKEHIKEAKKNKVNIIKTNMNTFETSRVILNSNYIKKIIDKEAEYVLHEKDYYDDFKEWSKNLQIDNYPVIDKNGICKGLLRKSEISSSNKRKVVLVDHNEMEQSAVGLDEAEIVEIVDHHKLGSITTKEPINFRNMIVGSTNTIIYNMYKEKNVKIDKTMAGLMIAGIISDTLLLKSPTTTNMDKIAIKELNKICKLNIEKFGLEMFKAGTSLDGMNYREVLLMDSKTFKSGDIELIISQAFTLDIDEILKNVDDYLSEMETIKNQMNVNNFIFVVTDIIKNGSYIFYDKTSEEIIRKAFHPKKVEEGIYLKNIVSRKGQIVPSIMDAIE